jgi:hypothetical protein
MTEALASMLPSTPIVTVPMVARTWRPTQRPQAPSPLSPRVGFVTRTGENALRDSADAGDVPSKRCRRDEGGGTLDQLSVQRDGRVGKGSEAPARVEEAERP